MLTHVGGAYDEILSPKITVLVCHNDKPNPEKVKYTAEKQIPIVHANWLWDCITSGEIQPFDSYLLSAVTSQPQKPRRRPIDSSNRVVPTAPLSKEDSIKLHQRKVQKTRLTHDTASNPSRRPGALELSASGPPTPPAADFSTNPNTTHTQSKHSSLEFEQDAQLTGLYDGTASLPLQDVDPNVNSPRKRSTSSTESAMFPKPTESLGKQAQRNTRSTRQPSPDSVIPPDTDPPIEGLAEAPMIAPPPEKDYSDIMSKLLATRKTSTPAEQEAENGRRKRRPLGRAQSGRSNTSDDVFSRHSSASKVVEEEEMGLEDGQVLDAFKPPEPSQMLGWDSPGAQRAREKMIRAIGGSVAIESPMIQETRVVKDTLNETSLGMGRASRKRRV